jgi:tRNA nucleotidyltransferase (CCA-adding enzyme)
MKTFLVGGAVRDRLLDYPVREHDWLVIGETIESMVTQGFRPVGKDFPVFLHPVTNEEYALARTERKTGPGYKGFAVLSTPDMTIEEDLLRRDLTINAMAIDSNGNLIDPFGGQADIQKRLLRHVSSAFNEDPVRILRVARFAARYSHLGFKVANETMLMMRDMVSNGEADHLVPDRIWAELYKALQEFTPAAFFEVLRDCRALAVIFPEIDALFGVPQPEKHHPEIDTGVHTLMVLQQAVLLSNNPEVRLAALLHDLGKALTPSHILPSHHGHELKGLPVLNQFCDRIKVPKSFKILCAHVMQYHTHCHRALELRADTLVDLLLALGAFKSDNRLEEFILACEADARGRTGFENRSYPQADYLRAAAAQATAVNAGDVLNGELRGAEIGAALRELRIIKVNQFKKTYFSSNEHISSAN